MAYSQRLLKGGARPSFLGSFGTLVAATPLILWAHDSLFSLCRVRESSMEPTLFSGDVLVVRKADGFWQRWTNSTKEETEIDGSAVERERILAYERDHCNSSGAIGLLRKPPTPITGNIVVFKNPETYPDQWSIKRVLGTGGETATRDTKMGRTVSYIPSYSLLVEGDNRSASKESRGPVSKKLLVGVAEYRVWPPWRIGKLDNQNIPDSRSLSNQENQ